MVLLKYDWSSIELQYVKGLEKDGKLYWPTKKELAEMYSMHPSYMREEARKRKWDDLRKAYLLRIERNDTEIEIENPKAELGKFNAKTFSLATNCLDQVYRKITDQNKAPNLQELNALIKILERIQQIGKASFNINDDDFNDAKSDFEKLMTQLKADEKAAKEAAKITSSEVETIDLRP